MSDSNTYRVKSEVWQYPGMAGWYFLSIPKKQSADIKKRFGAKKRGWGSLPIFATIGKTTWQTSIFPDKKSGSYLLPLKAAIRKKEAIKGRDVVSFVIKLRV